MNIPDLISLVRIGLALLAGLLVWRLIALSEQARRVSAPTVRSTGTTPATG